MNPSPVIFSQYLFKNIYFDFNSFVTYCSSNPIFVIRAASPSIPFVILEKIFELFLFDDKLLNSSLNFLTGDVEQMTSLLLTLGLSIIPVEGVGRNADTEVMDNIIIFTAKINIRNQVIRAEAIACNSILLSGIWIYLCRTPELIVRVQSTVLKPDTIIEKW